MNEFYQPKSDFLVMVANGEVPLTGTEFADQNLRLLIGYMSDADTSNRDWATLLLAGLDIDNPEVREALLKATQDHDAAVRAEALLGLAERDAAFALPLVERELDGKECGYGTFQAARAIASPLLLNGLRTWSRQELADHIHDEINDAIAACEAALGEIG
jgi:HEAT repeat protein